MNKELESKILEKFPFIKDLEEASEALKLSNNKLESAIKGIAKFIPKKDLEKLVKEDKELEKFL